MKEELTLFGFSIFWRYLGFSDEPDWCFWNMDLALLHRNSAASTTMSTSILEGCQS